MKHYLIAIYLCLFSFISFSEESKKITLTINDLKVIELPFVMEHYRPSNRGVIKVEPFSTKKLKIVGLKQGTCELEVSGGGLSKNFSISVVNNIRQVFNRLSNDLDNLPELDIAINHDYITIKGEVSNIRSWEHLQKVLPLYEGNCRNYAIFRPAPEIIINLKKLFSQSGFSVVNKKDGLPKPGDIVMQYSQNILTVSGEVFHPTDVERVNKILSTQDWLSLGNDKDSHKVKTIVNIKVVPTEIDVGIVYVALSKVEAEKIGSNAVSSILSFDLAAWYSTVTGSGGGRATFNTSLNGAINFFASNGVSRFKTAGHLTFISNDKDNKTATLHVGGTDSIRVQGNENGDLKDKNFGLTMKVGGGLISGNKVKLNLDLSRSDPVSAEGDVFRQKKADIKTSVICELNKTTVLGGLKDISESTSGPSGLAILRNTPVLNWFVSESSESKSDLQLLILVSPRLADNDVSIRVPPSLETKNTLDEASRSNEERVNEEKRHRGMLQWLNWFSW